MKNKKIYLVLIPIVIVFVLSIYLTIKLSNTQAVITNLCEYNEIVNELNNGNDIKISYEACGAKADGKSNAYDAMYKAHYIANKLYIDKGIMKTVYACNSDNCSDKTYYIGQTTYYEYTTKNPTINTIRVITNVDWGNANFIVDDYIDNGGKNKIDITKSIFNISTPLSAYSSGINLKNLGRIAYNNKIIEELTKKVTIKPGTTNLKILVDALLKDREIDNSNAYFDYNFYIQNVSTIEKYFKSSQRWAVIVNDEYCEPTDIECRNKHYLYKRKGTNADSGNQQTETIIIDSGTGDVLTDINWTYDGISSIYVYPISDTQISVGNGNFTTYTNNVVYTEDENGNAKVSEYTQRNIVVGYGGNVKLHNINHYLDESIHPYQNKYQVYQETPEKFKQDANKYYGFIRIHNSAYVKLEAVNISPHTYSNIVKDNEVKQGGNGTYDLTIDNSVNISINDVEFSCDGDINECYKEKMINTDKWTIMSSNNCKNMFITNTRLNKIDAHRGITNLYINNVTAGISYTKYSLVLAGNGKFYAENLKSDRARWIVSLRDDYGSTWDGTMVFNNLTYVVNQDSNYGSIIYSANDQSHDFGYKTYFPELYINDIKIDTRFVNKDKFDSVSLLDLSPLYSNGKSTVTGSQNSRERYYFKGNIYLSNATTNGNTLKLFPDSFVNSKGDTLNLNNYGGNNTVNLYLDDNVRINDIVNTSSNTKFKINSENHSEVDSKITETKNFFTDLMNNNAKMPTSLKPTIGSLNIGGVPQTVTGGITKYTSIVSSTTSSINIKLETAYTGTYIKWGNESKVGTSLDKTVTLNYGLNTFTFTVTNASNVSTSYTIEITRAHEPNIESISINAGGEIITPTKTNDTTYKVTVKSGIQNVFVGYSIGFGSTIPNFSVSLEYGDNNVPITVKNEAGETKTYTLTITRAHPPVIKNITLSDNNKLNEVVSSDRTSYTVDTYSSSLSINATPNDNTTISGLNSPITLQYGTNKVTFSITNDAGESTKYTLTIKRWYDFSKIVPDDYKYNYDNNFLYTTTRRSSKTILEKINDNDVNMKIENGWLKITNAQGESLTKKNTSGIKIACFGIDNLEKEIEGKNIKLTEKVSYETFKGAMSTTQAVWKLFDTNGKELTSGNIDSGYQLKIYYSGDNTILLDTYEINITINEYLEFINLNVDKENKIIKRIAPGTTYNSVINNISTNGNITIKDKNGSVLTGTSLAKTGDIIEIKMTNNTYNYTVSVLGDVTGDGIVSQADVTKLFQHYRGTISEEQKLTNAEILAGDVKEDNIIKLTDIAKLHQYENQKISSLN